MKKILQCLAVTCVLASPAFAADKTLPTLTGGGAVQDDDLFLTRQGADTEDKKVTGTQINQYVTPGNDSEIIFNSGGVLGSDTGLTFNSTSNELSATGAVFSGVGFDCTGAVDCDIGSADITDITLVTDGGTVTIDGSVTIPASSNLIVGANTLTVSDKLNGEQIGDDTIDDDSIDFTDVTAADITMTDAGAITSTGTITAAVGFDCTGAADCDFGSADILDMTFVTDGGTVTIDGSVTIPASSNLIVGANTLTVSDKLDGEQIGDDTIDDDSIDFVDVTLSDLTFDVGSVDTTEYGYLNGVTSAIQTQIDGKQPLDSELTTLAALTETNGNVIFASGGAWTSQPKGDVLTSSLQTKSADYTLALTDAGSYIRFNSTGNLAVTVPANATVAFPVDTEIMLVRAGSSVTLTVTEAGGVTVNSTGTLVFSSVGEIVAGTLKKVATNEWDLIVGQTQ